MAVPVDPAQVQAQFQAMTNQFAGVQQSVFGNLLTQAEANLARYGPGWHDVGGMSVNFEAQVAGLRADIAQVGQWLTNARALLASGSQSAIQAMQQMLASGNFQLIVEEGAATLEPAAPALVTGGIAGAGIAQASGMSLMAAVGLGLAGALVLAGVIGGGYWAYNHFHQTGSAQPVAALPTTETTAPPATTTDTDTGTPSETATGGPTATAPPAQQVPPPPPVLPPPVETTAPAAAVDIDGTYSLLAPSCPVSLCYLKVTRLGGSRVQFTLVEHTAPQYPNEGFSIGPMQADLDGAGAFQGTGTATEEDVGGQGHITHQAVAYTISGNFSDAQGGPPVASGHPTYHLTLQGDNGATTNGTADFAGTR